MPFAPLMSHDEAEGFERDWMAISAPRAPIKTIERYATIFVAWLYDSRQSEADLHIGPSKAPAYLPVRVTGEDFARHATYNLGGTNTKGKKLIFGRAFNNVLQSHLGWTPISKKEFKEMGCVDTSFSTSLSQKHLVFPGATDDEVRFGYKRLPSSFVDIF